jgi:hypothetical protein
MPTELVIDCSGQAQSQIIEVTDEDIAGRLAGLAEASQRRDAGTADRVAAVAQLKAKAKTDPNLALIARALGVADTSP